MILKFSGTLELMAKTGDNYNPFTVKIGGENILHSIQDTKFEGKVTVAWLDRKFVGEDIWAAESVRGYSEWTPAAPYELELFTRGAGTHDLVAELEQYRGQEITLWVADEPVNVLE